MSAHAQDSDPKAAAIARLKNTDSKDYYKILNVAPDASLDTIKKAFRTQAMLVHPDKNLDNRQEAGQAFTKLEEAYGVLQDAQKRAAYDQQLKDKATPPSEAPVTPPQQEQPQKKAAQGAKEEQVPNMLQNINNSLFDLMMPANAADKDDPRAQMLNELLQWVLSLNHALTDWMLGKLGGKNSNEETAPLKQEAGKEQAAQETPANKNPLLTSMTDTTTTTPATKLIKAPDEGAGAVVPAVTPVDGVVSVQRSGSSPN